MATIKYIRLTDLVKINVASSKHSGAIAPLSIDRCAQNTVGGFWQGGELALVEVNKTTLSGLHDIQTTEARLNTDLNRRTRTLYCLDICKRLVGTQTQEGVLVGSHLALGVGSLKALPTIFHNSHTDLVHDTRVFGDKMLAQKDAEFLRRVECVFVGHAVDSVLASISGNNVTVISLEKSRIHDITFKQDLDIILHNILSSISIPSHFH